MRGLEDGWP
jgi:hypothetical protein